MQGYLLSKDQANKWWLMGPDELSAREFGEKDPAALPLIGSYSVTNGEVVLFYRWSGNLRLRIMPNLPPIDLLGVTPEWKLQAGIVSFRLFANGKMILCRNYPARTDLIEANDDPTPFAEPEDFDFFLFITNVLSSPARMERIYRNA